MLYQQTLATVYLIEGTDCALIIGGTSETKRVDPPCELSVKLLLLVTGLSSDKRSRF